LYLCVLILTQGGKEQGRKEKIRKGEKMTENEISKHIVACAVEVHRTLGGPGLLESVYEEALVWELEERGLIVERQLDVPIAYKKNSLASPLRLDLLVNKKVIIEVKATTAYNSIFETQALTYLRLLNLKLALVINFGERYVKDGIHRVVNGL
jgi:GxxExxY protein